MAASDPSSFLHTGHHTEPRPAPVSGRRGGIRGAVPRSGRARCSRRTAALLRLTAREFLGRQAEEILPAGGKVGGTHLASGNAPARIVKLAEELHADLAVLGSRGLGGVRRALMGSVSDSVVRHAHNPVLVVREDQRQNG